MASLESAYFTVQKLVEDFKKNEKFYLSASYSEAEARRDFIDKFFSALGWDVYHEEQKNPYEQEVKVEKSVSVEKAQKRADYAYYISPNYRDPVFYVEAKKPAKELTNADYYFQVIRYGWNANMPVVVLTDFEEFHIIDARYKPNIKTALERNLQKYHYSEYSDKEKFARIYYLLSRESVVQNSIGKYSDTLKKVKGKAIQKGVYAGTYQSIDESFLEELDKIRLDLAKSFKKSNPNLNSEELTEASQRTIDRLVFIRFLEDKLIEPEPIVSEFIRKSSPWKSFITESKKLDSSYNGIVFKNHPVIDSDTFNAPADKEFGKICSELSHTNSPYDFDMIPIHILGSIYERFLGKVIHTSAKQVKIEEKPEVRKAGGVYYTPQYIVRYIVDNTVGKILRGETTPDHETTPSPTKVGATPPYQGWDAKELTPKEIEKLRFADIACGSGSFLITVFDTLLHYHSKWYNEHPEQAKKEGCIENKGAWVLSLDQKRKILTNNIYGVDIDPQAVEVTQLSLFLKLMEDETTASIHQTSLFSKDRILPDLSKNIKCGNSLIGTDILDGDLFKTTLSSGHPSFVRRGHEHLPLDKGESPLRAGVGVGEIDEEKIKPMDFETAFPEVMKYGGFDAIVGNPPYVLISDEKEKKYLNKKYELTTGKGDLFRYFIERSMMCLRKEGLFGYIIPSSILTIPACTKLREFLLNQGGVIKIVNFWGQVFHNVSVNSLILFTQRATINKNIEVVEVISDKPNENDLMESLKNIKIINRNNWLNNEDFKFQLSSSAEIEDLLNKIKDRSVKLFEIANYSLGMQVYHNTIHTKDEIEKRIYHSNFKKSDKYFPESGGPNVQRYYFVNLFKEYVEYGERCYTKPDWKYFSEPRILIREIPSSTLVCSFTDTVNISRKSVIVVLTTKIDVRFLLGILNSKLIGKYVLLTGEKGSQRLFPRISLTTVRNLPIKKIDLSNPSEKLQHDKIVSLVNQMLESKKKLHETTTESQKTYYVDKCNALDKQIDALVYELYGLTEEEIKVVEGV